jgi:AcrR family transcriptional regulator
VAQVKSEDVWASGGPRLPSAHSTDASREIHRARLVSGMLRAVAETGYLATGVNDVVRLAEVSKRTFYQHFADKQDCFLAAYDVVVDTLLTQIVQAVAARHTWQARLVAGVDAYVEAIVADPRLTRILLIEISFAGPAGLRRRRAAYNRWVEVLRGIISGVLRTDPVPPELHRDLTDTQWLAVLGAINELLFDLLEDGDHVDPALLRRDILDIMLSMQSRAAQPLVDDLTRQFPYPATASGSA